MQKQRQSSMLQFLGGRKGQGKGKGKGKGRGARPQDSAAPAPADPPASPAAAAPPPPTDDGSPIRKRLKSDSNPHSPEFRSPGGTTPPDPGATATAPGPSGPAQAPGPPPDGAAANADLPRQLSSDYVDAWDSHHVKLPCSPSYVYWTNGKMRSVWYLISDVLSTKIEDAEELQEAIEAMNPLVDQSDWDFTGLRCYFQVAIPEERSRQFFGVVLPQMQRLALRVSEVCPQPIPLLETGRGGTVELTQAQVCCLLCHAFFCTMPYRFRHLRIRNATRNDPAMEALEWRSYPSVNFLELYGAQNMAYRYSPEDESPMTQSQAAKLDCLVHYFTAFFAAHGGCVAGATNRIAIARKVTEEDDFPDWPSAEALIPEVICRTDGTIEDSPEAVVEVDFANKTVGGGVIGRGCVQEEIRFLLSPELLASRLVCETLDDHEALELRGATRYSRHEGYGNTFAWAGAYEDPLPVTGGARRSCLVAMDAVNFRAPAMSPAAQYDAWYVRREVCKAYAAFKGLGGAGAGPPLATGNWGCGVFGGDLQLKALLQLIAAAECGVPRVIYYCYGDAAWQAALQAMCAALRRSRVPCGAVFRALCEYEGALMSASSANLLELFRMDTDPMAPDEETPGDKGCAGGGSARAAEAPRDVFAHVRSALLQGTPEA